MKKMMEFWTQLVVGHCIFEPSEFSKSCRGKNKLLKTSDGSRNTIYSKSWIRYYGADTIILYYALKLG